MVLDCVQPWSFVQIVPKEMRPGFRAEILDVIPLHTMLSELDYVYV